MDRPILFSAPMVRALLAGEKTVTRRLAKKDKCPYGEPGDRLWVRETWRTEERDGDMVDGIRFRADDAFVPIQNTRAAADLWVTANDGQRDGKWRPSIFMPRWASRIMLVVNDVRQGALRHVDDADARLEGVESRWDFVRLWEEINGAWDDDLLVWRVAFRVAEVRS